MIEFKKDREKPVEVKLPIYKRNTIILWVFTAIMYVAAIVIITLAIVQFIKSQSGAEAWADVILIIMASVGSIIFVGGGIVIMVFAIIFTILYRHYRSTIKPTNKKA